MWIVWTPYGGAARVCGCMACLQLVFDLIVSQLRSLGKVDGPHYDRCLYILDSLATVKTCNALVDIAQGDLAVEDDEETAHRREQAHDVLVELFDVLLSRVS